MNKAQLIDAVAERAEMSKNAAARAVDAIFDTTSGAIAEAIRNGGRFAVPGFGRFRTKTRPARKGRNPRTGAEIDIPERTVVQFSAGKGLREVLAGDAAPKKRASGTTKAAPGKQRSAGGAKRKTGEADRAKG